MITHLEGSISELAPTYVVMSCNGVGYIAHISLQCYSILNGLKEAKLLTHLAIREDAHVLYGFMEESERRVFRMLISVSGVGASTARVILSKLTATEVKQAIVNGNVKELQSIKGIGAKTAQRIIIDLKDKMAKELPEDEIYHVSNNTIKDEALTALEVLGFQTKSVEKILSKILEKNMDCSVEDLIKLALKEL